MPCRALQFGDLIPVPRRGSRTQPSLGFQPQEPSTPATRPPSSQEHGGITGNVDLGKSVRLSGPYRAKRLFMFTQAKAWAEFSWPFGPSVSPLGNPRAPR